MSDTQERQDHLGWWKKNRVVWILLLVASGAMVAFEWIWRMDPDQDKSFHHATGYTALLGLFASLGLVIVGRIASSVLGVSTGFYSKLEEKDQ